MHAAGLADPRSRSRVYARLGRRNGLIWVLRLVVPAVGLLSLLVFSAQLYLASQIPNLSVGGVRFDRGVVTVDAPVYEGETADGSHYKVTAERADSMVSQPDLLDLVNAVLDFTRRDGTVFHATAEHAEYDLSAQTVFVPKLMQIKDTRGISGTLSGVHVDWGKQTVIAEDGVDLRFADGTILRGTHLDYYGKTNRWVITRSVLEIPGSNQADAQ